MKLGLISFLFTLVCSSSYSAQLVYHGKACASGESWSYEGEKDSAWQRKFIDFLDEKMDVAMLSDLDQFPESYRSYIFARQSQKQGMQELSKRWIQKSIKSLKKEEGPLSEALLDCVVAKKIKISPWDLLSQFREIQNTRPFVSLFLQTHEDPAWSKVKLKGEFSFLVSAVKNYLIHDSVANEAFKKYLISMKKNQIDPEDLKKISTMASRSYFLEKKYSTAQKLYPSSKLGQDGYMDQLIEKAWISFANQKLENSYASSIAFKLPPLNEFFYPESSWLLVSVLLKNCQYGTAIEVMSAFQKEYQPLWEELKKVQKSDSESNPKKFYQYVIQELEKNLPEKQKLLSLWGSYDGFLRRQEKVNHLADESVSLRKVYQENVALMSHPMGKVYFTEMRKYYGHIPKESERLQSEIGKGLWSITQEAREELEEVTRKILELQVYSYRNAGALAQRQKRGEDVSSKQSEKSLADRKKIDTDGFWSFGRKIASVTTPNQKNPTNQEVWLDEVANFRAYPNNICSRENKK